MACGAAGQFDPETFRYQCKVTGDDCFYMRPDENACARDFDEGPKSSFSLSEQTERAGVD